MIIKKKNIVYMLIIVMIVCSVFQNTLLRYSYPILENSIDLIYKIVRILVFAFGIIHFFSSKKSMKNIIGCCLFLSIFIFSFIKTRYFMFFDMFFIPLFFCDYLEYDKIIDIYLYTLIITLTMIIIMYFLHVFPNSFFAIYRDSNITYRNSFGFGHPNAFGRHVFLIISLFLLKKAKNISFFQLTLFFLLVILSYVLSKSRTPFYTIMPLFIYLLYSKYFAKFSFKSSIFKWLKKSSFLIIPFMMISFYLVFSSKLFIDNLSNISNTLVARYTLAITAINKYGFHLFGNKVQFVGKSQIMFDSRYLNSDYSQVDNFFTYFILTSGILAIVFFTIYYTYIFKKTLKSKNNLLTVLLIVMLIYSFNENSIVLFPSSFIFILPLCNYKNKEGEII